MGVSVSKTESIQKNLVEITTKSLFENTSNCGATNTVNQDIKFGNVGKNFTVDGLDFDSTQNISIQCLQSSENVQEIARDIKKNLETAIKNKVDGLTASVNVNDQKTVVESITKLSDETTVRNVKNCILNSSTVQQIQSGDVGGDVNLRNISFKAVQEIISRCVNNDKNIKNETDKIDDILKSSSSNVVAGFINANTFMIIIIVLVVVAGIVALRYLTKK